MVIFVLFFSNINVHKTIYKAYFTESSNNKLAYLIYYRKIYVFRCVGNDFKILIKLIYNILFFNEILPPSVLVIKIL